MASPGAGAAPALSVVLQSVAACLQAVRVGRSGTAALETVPAALRPAVQALFFETLRHLGMAQALRSHLAPRKPAAAIDALLCTALALMAPDASAAYEPHTLVNQAVEAAKAQRSTRPQAGFVNACLRRYLREQDALACLQALPDGERPQVVYCDPMFPPPGKSAAVGGDDGMAVRGEVTNEVRHDEAGGARDQDAHVADLHAWGRRGRPAPSLDMPVHGVVARVHYAIGEPALTGHVGP